MSEQWYAIIDSNKEVKSFTTVLPEELPEGLKAVEVDNPPAKDTRWNPLTESMEKVVVVEEPTDKDLWARAKTTDEKLAAIAKALNLH